MIFRKSLFIFFLLFDILLSASFNTKLCKNLNYNSKKLKNDCKRIDDLKSIASALDKSFRIHLNYTQPEKRYIDTSISLNRNWSSDSDLQVLVKEKFLINLPLDPVNNKEYFYFYEVLNNLKQPFYQLCASKLETTNRPYCLEPKRYQFYSDHLFITAKVKIDHKIISIATANILYGGGDPVAPEVNSALSYQVSVLEKVHPSIILFQEVEILTSRVLSRDKNILTMYENEIDYFIKKLKLSFFVYDIFKKVNFGTSGKLFLSKYPIIYNQKINNNLSIIKIKIDTKNIIVANMHLKPIKKEYKYRKEKVFESIRKLVNLYPNESIILAGDFFVNNLNLKKFGFRDTYYCNKIYKNKYKNTIISKSQKRYDYIFIKNLSCVYDSNKILLPNIKRF